MLALIASLSARSSEYASRVFGVWVLCATVGLATAWWGMSWSDAFTSQSSTPAAIELERFKREFTNLDSLITLKIVGGSSTAVATARDHILATLRAKPDIFTLSLSPGEGSYYQTHAILYLDKGDLANRVNYVGGLRPLLDGLAQSRSIAGLAALTANVAKATENGQNAQVFADLYNELARSIQAQLNKQPTLVSWTAIAGLDVKPASKIVQILAWPASGRNDDATEIISEIESQTFDGARVTVLTKPAPHVVTTAIHEPGRFAAATAMTVILSALLLLVVSGSAVFSFAVTSIWFLALGVWLALLTLASPFAGANMAALIAAALFALVKVAHGLNAFALASLVRSRDSVELHQASSDAARRMVVPCVFLAGFLGGFLFPELGLQSVIASCACLFLITVIAELTLVPAFGKYLLSGQTAHVLAQSNRRTVRKIIILVLAAISVLAQMTILPQILRREAEPAQLQPTVTVLALSAAEAGQRIEQLKSIAEVKGARWIGGFIPADVVEKIALLKTLEPNFPRPDPTTTAAPTAIEVQVEARKLEKSLGDIAAATGASESMRQAALSARRSLSLLLDSGPADVLMPLQRAAFAGLDELEQEMARVAKLKVPDQRDLDEPLRRLFMSPNGTYRIEVEPSEGTSANGLSYALASKGIIAASEALVQRENQRQIDRIMFVLLGVATLACFLLLVLARTSLSAALRAALVVMAVAMIEVLLLIASTGRFQHHHMIWALVIFASLWGQAAFTPATEVFKTRNGQSLAGADFLLWLTPLATFGLAASLWLVGSGASAALACIAATILLLSSCFHALLSPGGR